MLIKNFYVIKSKIVNTLKSSNLVWLIFILGTLYACSNDEAEVPDNVIPTKIVIKEPGLHPSKFDFDFSKNQFIVGSVTRGNIGHINPQTGKYSIFITDDNFSTVPEVFTDEENNRLLVTSGDLGLSVNKKDLYSYAFLGIYDLKTGEKIKGINFENFHEKGAYMMANGIAVDEKGDIYVADTFAPVIYKIDGKTYEAKILVKDERFTPNVPNPGLFGIVYVDGNLILSKQDDGVLFKVPVSNPSNVTVIKAPKYVGAKGMELIDNKKIAMSIGGGGAPFSGVITLSFNEDWTKATATSYFESLPVEKHPIATTIASDGSLYLMNSYFPQIFTGNPADEFSIIRVK